jgi:hypothetical protein
VEEQARKLIAGGSIHASDPGAENAAANQEEAILLEARTKKRELQVAIAGKIGFRACKGLAPIVEEALRAADDAAAWLFESLEIARRARGMLAGAGHEINSSAISIEEFPEAAQLGDPRRAGTPAARFRERLKATGVISP